MTPADCASTASSTENDDICAVDHDGMLNRDLEEGFRMTVIGTVDGVHIDEIVGNSVVDRR